MGENDDNRGTWQFAFTISMRKEWDVDASKVASFIDEDGPIRKGLYDMLKTKAQQFIFQLECTNDATRAAEGKDVDDIGGRTAPDRDNYHYQGYLKMKVRSRDSTIAKRFLDLGMDTVINVSYASKDGKEALAKYCLKKDATYRKGPWADRDLNVVLAEMDEEKEYDGSDLPKEEHLYTWQQDLFHYCSQKPDRRTVTWVCDYLVNYYNCAW